MSHPIDTRRLIDWLDDRLDPSASDELAAQLAALDPSSDVHRNLEWLRRFRAESSELSLESPPPVVTQRLRGVLDRRQGLAPPLWRIDVSLVGDSRQAVHVAGYRGATTDNDQFQLTYEGDGVEVVLDIRTSGQHCVIAGQVLPTGDTPPAFEAIALTGGGPVRTLEGDELGGFDLPPIPVDTTELVLSNGELLVRVPLDLRPMT